MRTTDGHGRRQTLRGIQLGVGGGPISLLLLPKCPLCLMPLFAALGIAIVPPVGLLYATAAILIGIWLTVVLVLGHRRSFVRLAAPAMAIATGLAVVSQTAILLWSAAVTMAVVGVVASRVQKCAMEG